MVRVMCQQNVAHFVQALPAHVIVILSKWHGSYGPKATQKSDSLSGKGKLSFFFAPCGFQQRYPTRLLVPRNVGVPKTRGPVPAVASSQISAALLVFVHVSSTPSAENVIVPFRFEPTTGELRKQAARSFGFKLTIAGWNGTPIQ